MQCLQPSTEVFSAHFRKPPRRKNGVRLVCFDHGQRKEQLARAKRNEYHRIWYERNRAKVIAKVDAWNKAHPEAVKARKSDWQARNIERHRKANREYARRKRAAQKAVAEKPRPLGMSPKTNLPCALVHF